MIRRYLPFLRGLKGYNRKSLRLDLVAGLTVALVLIPQSMAYAQLAGLPAYFGLYAALLPPITAALFGSSRQLATGPVAIVSLMTAAALEPLATEGSETFIAYAVLLALFVGIFQLSLGVLRLGALVNFVSHPVVIGLTNAAAIIIAASQLSKLFGVSVDRTEHLYDTIGMVAKTAVADIHLPSLALGLMAFAIMFGLKKLNPKIPYVLVAVLVTTVIAWRTGFEDRRTVSFRQIDTKEVRTQIRHYAETLLSASEMTEVRAAFMPEIDAIMAKRPATCGSCHSDRHLDFFVSGSAKFRKDRTDLDKARISIRALHSMAGLVDDRIQEEKIEAAKVRERLRAFRFEERKVDGASRYALIDGTSKHKALSSVWRMLPPTDAVDLDKLHFSNGGQVVGYVPQGLPRISAPKWDASVLWQLMAAAILISMIGFMEAISIAKAIAARTGQRLDPNQELIGQGIANIVGSFSQSYAVSGSFSRSAVNTQSGAVSGMSSVFTSASVLLALLFFTPLLYHLPQSVLAAIIMMAVVALFNVKGIIHAYRVKRSDGVISVITFAATLIFAPQLDKGILVGVSFSLIVFLYDKMKPVVVDLSLWVDGHFHNAARFHLKLCKHLAVIRFDGPLFFANTSYLEDKVLERVRAMPEIRAVMFKADGINEIDSSGEDILSLMVDRLRAGGIDVYFAGLNESVVDALHRSRLHEKIGADHLFASVVQAVESVWGKLHVKTNETACPLKFVVSRATGELVRAAKIRVLLVDNDVNFVKRTAQSLRTRGFDVDECHDGKNAIAKVQKNVYDTVVLEMNLRGEHDNVILRELTDIRPHLPVFLLTSHASVDSAVEAMRYGAVDCLMKPCDIEILVQKIRDRAFC